MTEDKTGEKKGQDGAAEHQDSPATPIKMLKDQISNKCEMLQKNKGTQFKK